MLLMHRKLYIYRRDEEGFYKWMSEIRDFHYEVILIRKYKATVHFNSLDTKVIESIKLNRVYEEMLKVLNDDEKAFLNAKAYHHVPPLSSYQIDLDKMYHLWYKLMFKDDYFKIKTITNKEVGQKIAEARKVKRYTRTDIAAILGIGTNTLRMYEEGKRTLRFNIYYMLRQFLKIKI